MSLRIRFLITLAAALAVVALASTPSAAVLLSDTFTGASLDSSKYALSGGAIGNVQQTGGELILTGGSEWFPRVGSQGTLPDNVKIETDIRIINPAPVNHTWEANVGIRASGAGFDSIGITAELFTTFQGNNSPDKLIIRRSGAWLELGQANLSADVVAGQVVTLALTYNAAASTAVATVTDKNTSTLLATVSITPNFSGLGIPAGGTFMLQSYTMAGAAFQSFKATDNGGAGAVVFEDDFETPIIDGAKWQSYPVSAAFASATGTAARLNGDDPLNANGDFAWLPTKAQFPDFDLQAVFSLADLKAATSNREGEDFFGVQFRVTNVADGYYALGIWPNSGQADINGSGASSPAIALLKGTGAGAYQFLAGPFPISERVEGSQLVVNVRMNGNSIEAFTGPDKTTALFPVLVASDTTNISGVVNFCSFGIVGIEVDEYSIWSAGTGEMPATPVPPAAALSAWTLYR